MTDSRAKGAAWERQVARMFREALGLPADSRKVRRSGGGQADGGQVPDVDVPHLWIECKVGPKQSPRAALFQAEVGATGTGRLPVAVVKHDRRTPFAMMRAETWAWFCDSTIGDGTDCGAADVPVRVDLDELLVVYTTRCRLLAKAIA